MTKHFARFVRISCVMAGAWMIGVFTTAACLAAAELTSEQRRTLATVELNLKSAESNAKLAADAAGEAGSTPSASRARLARTRLQPARSVIDQLAPMLATLPADHPDVSPIKKRFDETAGMIAELESRLSGTPAPAAGARLDHRQQEQLSNARFNLREVDARLGALTDAIRTIDATADRGKVDLRLVQTAINTIADAKRRAQNAADQLAPLPPDDAGVKDAADQLASANAKLQAIEKQLQPLHQELSTVVDPANHPELEADLTRLRELARMYGNLDRFQTDRAAVAELFKQAPAARDEANRIAGKYSALLAQQTEIGRQLQGALRHFEQRHAEFDQAATRQKQSLPEEISANIEQINRMTEQAVSEQKPAFFAGGIPQQLEFLKDKLVLFAALDPAGAEPIEKQVSDLHAAVKAKADSLKDAIIAANAMPENRYAGGDRAQLEQLASEAWKKVQPDAQILKIVIPSQNWQREESWRYWSGTWTRSDLSRIQVQLAVKHDDRLAVIRPINLIKDRQRNDQINAYPMDSKDESLEPRRYLPLNKAQ